MTRPLTNTVQYFFHSCEHGKTMFILEQRFGNDGYAFWFKLLETLGSAENHFLDLSDPLTFECLQAKAKIKDRITMSSYLDLLALLQAINPELWKFGIVWSQNFVDGLDVVYKNRKREIPRKPITTGKTLFSIGNYPVQEGINTVVIPLGNIGSKGRKEENPLREKEPSRLSMGFETLWKIYPQKREKGNAVKEYKKLNPQNGMNELMLTAIEKQIAHKLECDRSKQFCPEFPYFSRWLKKRKWEDEIISDLKTKEKYPDKVFCAEKVFREGLDPKCSFESECEFGGTGKCQKWVI